MFGPFLNDSIAIGCPNSASPCGAKHMSKSVKSGKKWGFEQLLMIGWRFNVNSNSSSSSSNNNNNNNNYDYYYYYYYYYY